MTSDAESEARRKSELLNLLKQGLEAGGLQVEISGIIQGASGARHTFDLIATKDGKRATIDVRLARKERVELGVVLETYAKSLDANARPSILVATPEASSDARKSAAAFGLVLVEGNGPPEVLERLRRALVVCLS